MQEWAMNTALNTGGIGSIRRPQDFVMPYARELEFIKTPVKDNVVKLGSANNSKVINTVTDDSIPSIEPTVQAIFDRYSKPLPTAHGNIVKSYDDNLHTAIQKYTGDNWATDNDELLKLVDNGSIDIHTNTPIMRAVNLEQLMATLNSNGAKIRINLPKNYSPYAIRPGSLAHTNNLRLEDKLADEVRNLYGTNSVAKTGNGKIFENNNDLFALHTAINNDMRHRFSRSNYDKFSKPQNMAELENSRPHLAEMYKELIHDTNIFKLPKNRAAPPSNFKNYQLTFSPPYSTGNFEKINGTKGNSLSEILQNFYAGKKEGR
jgi:hypothetical protein